MIRRFIMTITKSIGYDIGDTTIDAGDPVFIDVLDTPATLHGFYKPFYRIPEDVAKATSPAVFDLSKTGTGGRIRFMTDSDYLVIHAETAPILNDGTGISKNFDIFENRDGHYYTVGSIYPSQGEGKKYVEGRSRFNGARMRDLTVYIPIYLNIKRLFIAVRDGSVILPGSEYTHKTPVVFYGSSIVHGVGASRPSCTYPAIISRRYDTEYINLGFAGAAKCEPAIIDYISTLRMSIFVYDYDHNAPSPKYLAETHYEGYKRFRAVQPDTPVIMASKPDYYNPNVEIEDAESRRQTILESYRKGVAEGDKKLYVIDGSTFYEPEYREESTADGCHPNDVGYLQMAKKFGAIIGSILNK